MQAGWYMHSYPACMFKALNYTARGTMCVPDRPPAERHLDFNSASNLYGDAQEVLQDILNVCDEQGRGILILYMCIIILL